MSDSGTPVNGELIDAADITGGFVPAGVVLPYAGTAAPTGYLLCDGSAVSRTTYAGLFTVCGTAFGIGDGSTTFNLPDMRERVPVGKGTVSGFTAVGTSDGVAEASRAVSHTHTGPSHTHDQNLNATATVSGYQNNPIVAKTNTASGDLMYNGASGDGGGSANKIVKTGVAAGGTGATGATAAPYLVCNYIIKT